MTDPTTPTEPADDAFDLEIEASPDTDEIMREAVEAVESHQRDEATATEVASSEATSEEEQVGEVNEAGEEDGANAELSEATPGLARQLKEAQERTVRALADYENFRRRVDRERVDYARYSAEGALTEFLPVIDNLGRAIDAEGGYEDLKSGVEMIHKQMIELLARLDVNPVPSVGERFDPSVHEAVARVEDDSVEQPTVLEEYQVGYVLHDRLLRPSMVRVAVPSEDVGASGVEADDEGREE